MDAVSFVKGSSKVFGLIGNPVSHSISPIIHHTISKYLNDDIAYVPFCVEKNIKVALEGAHALGIEGLNVTVPHKKNVMPFLANIDEEARQIGAVNTLKRTAGGYEGYNTDIIGLQKTFAYEGLFLENKEIVIFGAGGTACSAGLLAAKQGAKKIYIVNRTKSNAENLAKQIQTYYNANIAVLNSGSREINECDIVIQTTSVGMYPKTDESVLERLAFFQNVKEVALDVIYTPQQTKFLSLAAQCGVRTINGFAMLIYQAIASYEIWNGISISKNDALQIKDAIRAYLT